MKLSETLHAPTRASWRKWLKQNYATSHEVWLRFPKKASGLPSMSYNDAVEEALCFGWIDSTRRSVDEQNSAQRFSPRRPRVPYSQPNIERMRKLLSEGSVLPDIAEKVADMINAPFAFPPDIIAAIKADKDAWVHYQNFSPAYKRIRIAYIDGARDRPDEFKKRLANFIKVTAQNKQIGYGGINAYY